MTPLTWTAMGTSQTVLLITIVRDEVSSQTDRSPVYSRIMKLSPI